MNTDTPAPDAAQEKRTWTIDEIIRCAFSGGYVYGYRDSQEGKPVMGRTSFEEWASSPELPDYIDRTALVPTRTPAKPSDAERVVAALQNGGLHVANGAQHLYWDAGWKVRVGFEPFGYDGRDLGEALTYLIGATQPLTGTPAPAAAARAEFERASVDLWVAKEQGVTYDRLADMDRRARELYDKWQALAAPGEPTG